MRGLAQVTAAHRDARRGDWHILMHPPCAAWSQLQRHPAGAARRSIPGVSATDPIAAIEASASARTQRSEKRAAFSDGTLPYINESSLVSCQKPMGRTAKYFCYQSARTRSLGQKRPTFPKRRSRRSNVVLQRYRHKPFSESQNHQASLIQ